MSVEPYLLYTVAVISLGTFQFGYNMAELNEPRDAMSCPAALGGPTAQAGALPECIPMASWEFGLVTSIFALGGLCGALTAQPLGNCFGRRSTLALNSLGFIVAGVMKALATNVPVLTLGRFVSGLSSGAAAVVVPLYINEIAPPDAKGKFGAITQISVNIGILATQILGLFLSKPQYWRLILLVGAAVGALQGALLLGIPESPKYLVSVGNRRGARDSLTRLRGASYMEDEIREEEPLTGAQEAAEKVNTWAFVTRREHRKAALVVCGLMLAQQLTGINACILHGVSILQRLLPQAAGYINVIISAANLAITSLASLYFDRLSHKKLLLASMLGMGSFAFLLALGIAHGIAILSAVALLLFVASFSFGLGPLPWMVASRTVDFKAVDAAQSAGLVVNWLATFAVAFIVPIIPPVVSFVGFGFVGFLSAVIVYYGVEAY